MRWADFLFRLNFRLVYRPGSVDTRADALSRRPQDAPRDILDDRLSARRIPLIPSSKFHHTFSFDSMSLNQIDASRPIDDLISESYYDSLVMQEIMDDLSYKSKRHWRASLANLLKITFSECRIVAGRVYYRDRLIIPPDDESIQLQLLHRAHNSGPAGHPGRERAIDLINRTYWWPGMTIAARKLCKGCLLCTEKNTQTVSFWTFKTSTSSD
ncbi:hypothetical protein K3495_g974 [Podosphaera aphanis]|nr:hypothetical protein K3495_g974 [Podosphaera aphanis]